MNKPLFLLTILLTTAVNTYAVDWGKAANDLMGDKTASESGDGAATAIDFAKGLLPAISETVGVSDKQAEGGLGSLLELAQGQLGSKDFSSLANMIPNVDGLLSAAPAVASSDSPLGGLLGDSGKALGAAQKVYGQFKSLGLSPDQIGQYITVIQGYLQSEGGQAAVDLFNKGTGALAGG